MVCISCIVIPVFIWIWYRFIQPILSTVKLYFNPAAVKNVENEKNSTQTSSPLSTEKLIEKSDDQILVDEPKKDL